MSRLFVIPPLVTWIVIYRNSVMRFFTFGFFQENNSLIPIRSTFGLFCFLAIFRWLIHPNTKLLSVVYKGEYGLPDAACIKELCLPNEAYIRELGLPNVA